MVGTESFEYYWPHTCRRAEMAEYPEDTLIVLVVVRRFSRKTIQHIPRRVDAKFMTPFQQLHVLDCGHAFTHQAEQPAIHALDAWLYAHYPRVTHGLYLAPRKVGFDFVKDVEIDAAVSYLGKKLCEILHRHDVVHGIEHQTLICA